MLAEIEVQFIIFVMFISTVRDIIAYTGLIPADSAIGKWVYRVNEELLIERVLHRLGVDRPALEAKLSQLPSNVKRCKSTRQANILDLVHLVRRYILVINTHDIYYGTQSSADKSNYYIDTMEAAHNSDDLSIMVSLMSKLIAESRNGDTHYPDFILTPKSGNVILAKEFTKICTNMPCLVAKTRNDNSRARSTDGKLDLNMLKINYEGYSSVKMPSEGERKLRGAIITCNASGGSEILEVMNEFNECIRELNLPINKVTDVFMLYRPDNNIDIDVVYGKCEYNVFRYLDLDEECKDILVKTVSSVADRHANKTTNSLRQYLCCIQEKTCVESSEGHLKVSVNINELK